MAYSTLSDIQRTFSSRCVADWSDTERDGNTTTMTAKQNRAIEMADEEIDATLRNGPYVVPLVKLDGSVPPLIEEISATLAGIWLYEANGVSDIDPNTKQPVHRYTAKLNWARQWLESIRDGKRVITGLK
jgi:phage gp36-like protein